MRFLLQFFFLVLLCPSSLWAGYWTASVVANVRPGPEVDSAAGFELWTDMGSPAVGIDVNGFHPIALHPSGSWVTSNSFWTNEGEITNLYVRTGASYDTCYRGRLQASTAGNYAPQLSIGSTLACVGAPNEPPPGEDQQGPPDGTPIVLDLDGDQIRLVGQQDAVLFDLDADGILELTTWTDASEEDAFLVLDRNGNHLVDDGSELFGDRTPLMNGTMATHGFIALQQFDEIDFGGNGDGMITAADAVYALLSLWTDWDHDGITGAGELTALSATAVLSIDLDFHETRRRDAHGNEFRYESWAFIERPGLPAMRIRCTDVVFVLVE